MTLVSTRWAIGSEPRSIAWLADAVLVRYTVRDVLAVGPHAESRPVSHGFWPLWDGFLGDMHLDFSAFGQLYIFQWFEHAVFVFRGNGHGQYFPICNCNRKSWPAFPASARKCS